ncbi:MULTISPECIES: OmpA family protein [Photorhabdus]|nr:OmpA family protein [Photorhabdus asymbiotica]RKS59397.1 OmpA family protein [Photorhabdus asymbiotica]
MLKIKCIWLFFGVMSISACSSKIKDGNLFLDMDWKQDIYNLVYTNADDVDNLRFWVRQPPEYTDGSPHQRACVEVQEAMKPSRFYIANLSTYGFDEISNCGKSYLSDPHFVKGKNLQPFSDESWNKRSDVTVQFGSDNGNKSSAVATQFGGSKLVHLIFSELFPVNESQLTSKGKATLLVVIKELSSIPVSEMTIYGIADSSGNYPMNKVLANKRAESVRQFLIEEGLRDIPIFIRGSVENSESTALQRVQQRRFMIEVRLAP